MRGQGRCCRSLTSILARPRALILSYAFASFPSRSSCPSGSGRGPFASDWIGIWQCQRPKKRNKKTTASAPSVSQTIPHGCWVAQQKTHFCWCFDEVIRQTPSAEQKGRGACARSAYSTRDMAETTLGRGFSSSFLSGVRLRPASAVPYRTVLTCARTAGGPRMLLL